MALKLNERYPGRMTNPSADYPQGSFKNRSTPTAKDGSYLEKDWANDKEGFFQSLLSSAGIEANGLVDRVGSSQSYSALTKVIKDTAVIQATEVVMGSAKVADQTATNAGTDDTSFITPKKLASWFSTKFSQASETVAGLAKVATQTLTNNGVDDTTIVTPKKLLGWVASGSTVATEALFGFVKIASTSQATTATNDTAAMTPLKTAQALAASNTSQTLQNVIGSRTLGGSYNNNTGKTITVMVSIQGGTGAETCVATVAGVTVYTGDPGYGTTAQITFAAPHGTSYSVDVNPKSGSNLQSWVELR